MVELLDAEDLACNVFFTIWYNLAKMITILLSHLNLDQAFLSHSFKFYPSCSHLSKIRT